MHEAEKVVPTNSYNNNDSSEQDIDVSDQAVRYLDFIFHDLSSGFVEFRYLSPVRRNKIINKPLFFPLPFDYKSIARQVITEGNGQIIVVGPAPRFRVPQGGKAGKDHDVLQVGCVWADVEYGAHGGAIEALRRIRDFPLRPSLAVNTGYGRQVYFTFKSHLSDSRLLDWDDLMRDLRNTLHGTESAGLGCALLLPGSRNAERYQSNQPCFIDEDNSSWLRYSIDELNQAFRKSNLLNHSGSKDYLSSRLSATFDERGVSREVFDAIVTGRFNAGNRQYIEERDHHERDLWIASSLLDCGFDKEEVKTVFRSHPRGCGSHWSKEKNGDRYLEFIVRTAAALRRRQGLTDVSVDESEDYVKLPPGYVLDDDGSLWLRTAQREGERKAPKPVKVSNSFIGIRAIHENIDTGAISLVIEYKYLERIRRKTILRSQMADARQLVSSLAGDGAPVTTNNARHVTTYLAAYEHAFASNIPSKKITGQFGRGRRGGPFFLPGVESDVEFSPVAEGDASLFRAYSSRRGTLQGWLEIMRTIAAEGLMIPQVAILASFVPPLQSRLQIPNFILDIHGSTSTGKSTALKLAASVYRSFTDPDSLVMQWMNTKMAVEQLAGMCSELPIFLDDAQHCPDEMKRSAIYMIANGRGKGRATRVGGIGQVSTWHTVALSTSEEPLHESSPHEGARGRILPLGGSIHPFPSGSGSLVQSLERAALLNHGYAGEAYIKHLNNLGDTDWSELKRRYMEIRKEFLTGVSSNVVDRVGGYIASIQLGAEIVCPLIRLPFKPESVGTWLLLHLMEEQSRQNHVLIALRALADLFVKHGSNFSGYEHYDSARKNDLYGAVQQGKYVAFLRDTFDSACRRHKWNSTAVLNKLADAGVLVTTESDRHTKRVSVGRVKHRMICIKWSALFPDDLLFVSKTRGSHSENHHGGAL
jgi:hypothetical protein